MAKSQSVYLEVGTVTFRTGLIVVCFHCLGTIHMDTDRLNNLVNGFFRKYYPLTEDTRLVIGQFLWLYDEVYM